MNKKLLYSQAYRILNRCTPLKTDCGTLCEKACCKGCEEESGMYLFPGENIMYKPVPEFLTIKPADSQAAGNEVLLAVCSGECDRALRPLACRIFPLTPYLSEDNTLTVIMDPRASHLCPIALYSSIEKLDQFFVKAVRNVFRSLILDSDIKDYILWLSRMLDDYIELHSKLTSREINP